MFDKFLKLFGDKEESYPAAADYGVVGLEFHNHVLPGIDDGARTIDDSIAMLQHFAEMGFRKVVATPHSMAEGYVNPTTVILKKRDEVREAMVRHNIRLEFDAAAEYYMDEEFIEKVNRKDLLPVGKNFVLMELTFATRPPNLNEVIYKLQTSDYKLILAHPERYAFFHDREFEAYESLKTRGVYFQINLGSLIGKYGPPSQHVAERMIDMDMVEFVGSDLHTPAHTDMLRKVLKEEHFKKLVASGKLLNNTLI